MVLVIYGAERKSHHFERRGERVKIAQDQWTHKNKINLKEKETYRTARYLVQQGMAGIV